MSVLGQWRIVEMPDYTDDYPDMMEPSYILFEPAGAFAGGGDHDAIALNCNGNDEMDEACGDGWAELQSDGTLKFCFYGGNEISFTACRWSTSSTAC